MATATHQFKLVGAPQTKPGTSELADVWWRRMWHNKPRLVALQLQVSAASLRPTALHMQDVSDIHNEQGSEASG